MRWSCCSTELVTLPSPFLAAPLPLCRSRVRRRDSIHRHFCWPDRCGSSLPCSALGDHVKNCRSRRASGRVTKSKSPPSFAQNAKEGWVEVLISIANPAAKTSESYAMSHKHSRNHRAGHNAGQQDLSPQAAADAVAHEMSSEHRRGLLFEKYFRWRAGEITRLEAFCDVVFGFAITLLVVSLEVPRNYAELMTAMRGFAPFAVCFAQLVMIWRAHYIFSRRYGLEDTYTMVLNVMLLFVV